MASLPLEGPKQFDFSSPDDWPKWIRRFERFREASGLSSKPEERQVNTLIYSMGDKADDILTSFGLSNDDRKKYSTVKERFDQHFVKKRNVIFERAKFNSRRQRKGETVDSFITDLHCLAEHCAYGNLHEEMIRDRLVVGLLDSTLSEKMQLNPDLTLEKAVTMARQSEAVHKQQDIVRGTAQDSSESLDLEALNSRKHSKRTNKSEKAAGKKPPSHVKKQQPKDDNKCTRCGKTPWHNRQQCPAKDAECHKCRKVGHYSALCYSSKMSEVTEESVDPDETSFLGTIHSNNNKQWLSIVSLNQTQVSFKLDTGAEV